MKTNSCSNTVGKYFTGLLLGMLSLASTALMAGPVVSGVQLTVNPDDTVTITNQGGSAFPGSVGAGGLDPYINGWSVTSGTINWTDTNGTPTLRMNSSGINVLNAGGIANSNGNKTGSVVLAGDTTLGAALRASLGVGSSPFTSTAVQNGGTAFTITGTANVMALAGTNPDIAITSTESADPVTAGGGTTFTHVVTAANITTNAATGVNVTVTPTLPAGVTLMSATPSAGTYVGTNWSVGNLGSMASETLTLTYSVGASTANGSTVDMTASLASLNETDDSAANNMDSESTTVNTSADLSITKVDSTDPVIAGNALTYTLTVNNAGPSDAAGVVVTDTLPAGVTLVSTSGCAEDPNGVPACSLGTIAAGGSAMYTINVTVDSSTSGTITNNASVSATTSDPNGGNNSASEGTTVNTSADLSITKTDSADPVIAGNALTYTITVSNAGPSDAQGVSVADTLPAGVTLVSTTGCAEDPAGVPTCTLGTVAAGGSAMYTVDVTVDSSTTGSITNMVSVTTTTSDPNGGNNSASETTTVNTDADLSITKTDSVDPVLAGNSLVYTLTVSNAGPSDAQSVVVTDTLPAGVSNAVSSGCAEDPNGVPTCSLGNIAAGGSAMYTVTVDVDPGTSGTLANMASVTSATADSNGGNNSVTENTGVNADADLSITKTDSVDPVVAGTNMTYTITVNNNGPSDATGVSVADTLPAGVTLNSTTGCAEDPAGIPTCSLGNIADGGSAMFTVDVTVDPATTGTLSNTATVSATTPDSNAANDSATEMTATSAESDLSLVMSGPPTIITPSLVTFTIDVTNNGPSDAANVVVTDTLSAPFNSVTTLGCAEDPNGYQDCSLGTIPAGGMASYDITFDVIRTNAVVTNTATVTSDSVDNTPGNNSAAIGAASSAVPVPTLNTWATILAALLLMGVGLYTVRRLSR